MYLCGLVVCQQITSVPSELDLRSLPIFRGVLGPECRTTKAVDTTLFEIIDTDFMKSTPLSYSNTMLGSFGLYQALPNCVRNFNVNLVVFRQKIFSLRFRLHNLQFCFPFFTHYPLRGGKKACAFVKWRHCVSELVFLLEVFCISSQGFHGTVSML